MKVTQPGMTPKVTVYEVARATQNTLVSQLRALGIDPDWTMEEFKRWLRQGQNVDTMEHRHFGSDRWEIERDAGWNDAIDHARD